VDVAKNIFKKSSIGVIVFFILNANIIIVLFSAAGLPG